MWCDDDWGSGWCWRWGRSDRMEDGMEDSLGRSVSTK